MFEIVFHPLFNELHELVEPKPVFETYETPMRTRVIWEYLKSRGYFQGDFNPKGIINNPDIGLQVKKPNALRKKDIVRVHSPYLYELVEHLSSVGYGQIGNLVQASHDSLEIALLSAGGAYLAIEDVYIGGAHQSFALVRPPGHHAIRDESDGLCVFNNIAVAVEKLRNEQNFQGKVAILDIDTHLGDGLSKLYYEDPHILYSSIHEYVPGESGIITEIGAGKGKGFNICYPVPLEADDAYLEGYCRLIEDYLMKYRPEMVIIALGLDGHWADPIGNLAFTSKGYQDFAKWIHGIADKLCEGKIVFVLEGGYNLLVLPYLTEIFLSEFTRNTINTNFDSYILPFFESRKTEGEEIEKLNQLVKNQLNPYWD